MPGSTAISARDSQRRACVGSQGGVGDPDDDQDHVRQPGHRRAVGCGGFDLEPSRLAASVRVICRTVVPVRTSTPRPASSAVDQGAERRVDGGQDLGELFHLDDVPGRGW